MFHMKHKYFLFFNLNTIGATFQVYIMFHMKQFYKLLYFKVINSDFYLILVSHETSHLQIINLKMIVMRQKNSI